MKITKTAKTGQWILEFAYWQGSAFCLDKVWRFDKFPIIVLGEWKKEVWEVGTVYVLQQEYGKYILWQLPH